MPTQITEILITSTVFIALKFIKHRVFLLSGISLVVRRFIWDEEIASSILAFPNRHVYCKPKVKR